MARDEAYREAEKKIVEARRSGATELDLSDRWDSGSPKLTELPESLGQLTQLQSLDLGDNQLTVLPEWLGQLTQLRSLRLSKNQLTVLPEWLGQLTQLQLLYIGSNRLASLPQSLGRLAKLQQLQIGGNQFGEIPEVLRVLSQLKELYLYDIQLKSIPDWIFELRSLEKLSLMNDQLTDLPSPVGHLTHLNWLYLLDNRLTDLPSSLAQLEHLEVLILANNPLNPELAAAYKEGLDAVKRYLRAKAGAQVVLNEAKLILIGEGEVGKSCLLGALRGDKWVEGRPTTHGIEIKPVKVTDPDRGTEITLNGWDFGGQRVYRPTHQLFFSAPAVYLVVWKPREGPQQGFVKEWIKLVKLREPEPKFSSLLHTAVLASASQTWTGKRSGTCSDGIRCSISSMWTASRTKRRVRDAALLS
jgi:hypothetical protein